MPALRADPGIDLVAVASRDAAKAARYAERFGAVAVVGYQTLLDRDDVTAVYIPVPTGLHAEWIGRALRAGKHVLAEKPLTTDPAETKRLLAYARSARLVLMENFMFTHHSQHDAVAALVGDGVIGQVRGFASTFTIPPLASCDIRYRPELGGGCLLDVGGYPIRASQLFLGPDLQVCGSTLHYKSGVDVAGAALLTTPEGISAQLSFGMVHTYRSNYEIIGTEGRIRLERAFTPPPDHKPIVHIERPAGTEQIILEPCDQFGAVVRAFAEATAAGCAHGPVLRQAELVADVRRLARPGVEHPTAS
jgi:predicted dehydrogenase